MEATEDPPPSSLEGKPVQLAEKVVLVTGAALRLGEEISRALSAQGARIAVHYRSSRGPAAALAKDLPGSDCFAADFEKVEEVQALVPEVVARMGRLDAVVHSAAIFERQPFAEATPESLDRHFQVNLKAPFLLSQAFVAQLPEDREGRILHLGDARGDVLDPFYPAYSLSKAGLPCMTRGLAVALAPRVRVFGLVLGHMIEAVGGQKIPMDDAILEGYAEPGTTGEAAAFLLGPGDFATGSLLYLDGGRHLKGGRR